MKQRMELAKPPKQKKKPAQQPTRDEVPPVENRKHADIQTEAYLEEISDRMVEADVDTQTDAFMDRPAAPIFVPMKTGVDVETHIEEGDLFDFDLEVDPILEVLVGKTLEQAMMEVMEEEELAAMKQHQDQFEQIRNVELAETQRMEEAEKRRFEEKERRVAQEQARLQREAQVMEKVAAHAFTKGYLQDLHNAVFKNLRDTGFFYNPLEREITTEFLPGLVTQAQDKVEQIKVARQVTDNIIAAAVAYLELGPGLSDMLRKKIADRKAEIEAAEIEAARAAAEALLAAQAPAADAPVAESDARTPRQ